VWDGRFSGTATVTVLVREAMDSGLLFTFPVYSASVRENVPDVTLVAVVNTVGHRLNEPLKYALLNPSGRFTIRPTCGAVLTTGVPFDREDKESYELVVEVSREDEILRVARVTVQVQVGLSFFFYFLHSLLDFTTKIMVLSPGGGCERQRSRVCEPPLLRCSAGGSTARIGYFQGLSH